ncbi:MAG TPA: hypothetical protein IAC94_07425 [Candidatus Coprenecus avistercoris]|uniref:CCDC81-like prokaryotic HU domain-containing protein n=1 Tax=Candidatus Coprenecus avistercoris TaxID=2840730 RepID=A0A9D1E2E7_9BACT|nr:hypothetical protein [Candidatus Coprenecus avistercoris]
MDVLLLSRLLKELIIDNDRIPLPGMGYFQTEPMPAYFSEDGKTIYPPSKRISFKGDERAAGDLVARYYAAGTGMDGKTAATELEAFLQQLKVTLQERKNIEFPGLGRLRSTLEGNVYFVAEKDGGIFAQAFGFEPVTLKPVKTAPVTAATETAAETPATAPTPTAAASPAGTEKPAQTETAPKPAEPTSTGGKKGHRILFIILGILAALIIAAVILVELGRSGKLDHLIYSDEELELLEQHGM